jgi:translation initiation factor 1
MAKKRNDSRGIVYSTNPDFAFQADQNDDDAPMAPEAQRLLVQIDRRQRKGKEVTLVTGFVGPESSLKELGKMLKTACGVGGSVKQGEVLLQGDHRDKVIAALLAAGYKAKRGN